jgi:heat shock protein HslJ
MSRYALPLVRAVLLGTALLLCVVVTLGCSSSTSPTIGTISTEGFAGEWRLELLQPANEGVVLTPAGATYTLTLSQGIAAVRADCNVCSGRFSLLGDSFDVGTGLACTRAACPTASFESIYTRILAGESRVGIDASTMALVSARGMLRFKR